mmetsp:Transcript_926/g.2115  ORF Transcript_926/g.2115 Transcript_926/m.2115 type:complete len:269 (-) Transcript_926:542-1348(-)
MGRHVRLSARSRTRFGTEMHLVPAAIHVDLCSLLDWQELARILQQHHSLRGDFMRNLPRVLRTHIFDGKGAVPLRVEVFVGIRGKLLLDIRIQKTCCFHGSEHPTHSLIHASLTHCSTFEISLHLVWKHVIPLVAISSCTERSWWNIGPFASWIIVRAHFYIDTSVHILGCAGVGSIGVDGTPIAHNIKTIPCFLGSLQYLLVFTCMYPVDFVVPAHQARNANLNTGEKRPHVVLHVDIRVRVRAPIIPVCFLFIVAIMLDSSHDMFV